MNTEFITTNSHTPLGVNLNEATNEVEFRLFSKNATSVYLCIFDSPIGENAVMTLKMKKDFKEENIWKTSIKNYVLDCKNKPIFYGFRVFGDNWVDNDNFEPNGQIGFKSKFDSNGNRFNPNKIAYDPYSPELSHTPTDINQSMDIFRSGSNFYLINNEKYAVKSVYKALGNAQISKVNPRPFSSEVIGEVHVKDLTQTLQMNEKGTYKGAGKFALSIKNLGISMIEFLPINEFDSRQSGGNHWGYMPLGYFSLARKYAYDKSYGSLLNEFRSMVDEFHKNDVKVCLDMVYNHTGEAGLINNNPEDANLISYSLIDNATYYKTFSNGYYRSNSGCGNDFNVANKNVEQLIIDSLVFWINQGVDAFRFDLAAALLECNENANEVVYDSVNSLAGKLKEELRKRNIKVVDDFNKAQEGIILIAEPWTCGGNCCYQLGNFPEFWAEWNDYSRDIYRKITIKSDEITPRMIREVLEGSPSRFKTNKSVNYIASHDGFSLYDLNSYSKKNPTTNGGSDWEICGDYKNNTYFQENAIRKQLVLLFLSYGIPMVQIGDIIMHTKNGNNNSYNKDNSINYLNWAKAVKRNCFENRIMEFSRNLIKFRKENYIFQDENFRNLISYHYDNGDIASDDNKGYWDNPKDVFFGALLNSSPNRIYIASNKKNDDNLEIKLPQAQYGKSWHIALDTSNFEHISFKQKEYIESKYILKAQALAIFIES